MKILILHGLDDIATSRRTSIHHALFLPRHAPQHDYWFHAAHAPVTDALRREEFDAIIIDTTFLCWRWVKPAEQYFAPLKANYDFLRDSHAIKIAFPQDEYDHSQILEDWLTDWKIDIIYSVCFDDRAVFYPHLQHNAEIRFGYTGLFEPADLSLVSRHAMPWRDRPIDVGYRARRLPPYFGRFGMLKSDIADRFDAAAAGSNLVLDISCEAKDALPGDTWLRFLGSCRFILGCESGSSLLDPQGDIQMCCNAYRAQHPDAGYEEVETACFPGLDRENPFKAISPRLFEAAATGCAQILVPGHYAGVLRPWEHYLPLAPDVSNIDEIVDAMRDTDRMEAMAAASRKALLDDSRFSYAAYAADVLSAIGARRPDLTMQAVAEPVDAALRLALMTGERWARDYTVAATPRKVPMSQKTSAALLKFQALARRSSELLAESRAQRSIAPLRDSFLRQLRKLKAM